MTARLPVPPIPKTPSTTAKTPTARSLRLTAGNQTGQEKAAEDSGSLASVVEFLDKAGAAVALKKASHAFSTNEVVATLAGGLAQLLVGKTAVKDFDRTLREDFRGTIKAHVKFEASRKALLTLGDMFGDKAASTIVAAGMQSLFDATVALLKNERFRALYNTDPKAFGLELALVGGKGLGAALNAAWSAAMLEQAFPRGLKWLARIPLVQKLANVT